MRKQWANIAAAVLMTTVPVAAALAQPLPNWSIQQDCQGDKQCTDGEVGARNFLTDKTWQAATLRSGVPTALHGKRSF